MADNQTQFPSILEEIPEDELHRPHVVDDDDEDIDEERENVPADVPHVASANPAYDEQSFVTPGYVPPVDDRTPFERIRDLMVDMASCRRLLMSVMGMCREALPVEQVNATIDDYRMNEYTVFSAASITAQLEKAGALERVTAQGEPFEEAEVQPQMVEVDGVEFLEPVEPPVPYWRTTEAGLAILEANNPLERLKKLFEDDAPFLPAYKSILILANKGKGVNAQQMSAALMDDPLLKNANLLPAHFVQKLDQCDALVWKDGWVTSDIGKQILEQIKDVEAICTELPAPVEISDEQMEATFIDPFDSLEI